MRVNFLCFCIIGLHVLAGCDLQPKIASIPDSVGAFISDRYPALLADPESQPEIYNSAVTDYGVYASPELYGSANIDDYVLYASVDDYVLAPVDDSATESEQDTENSQEDVIVAEHEIEQDYIVVPTYGGFFEDAPVSEKVESEKINPDKKVAETSDNDVVMVVKGDTLYSVAKKHNMSVDELAKMICAASVQSEINGVINVCTGNPMSLADKVESFIKEKGFKIKLKYGAFPDRPYDSPGTWGDATLIKKIMEKAQ